MSIDVVGSTLNGLVYGLYARSQNAGQLQDATVADAELVHQILSHPDIFEKHFALVGSIGDSRFNTNGREWAGRRDVTQHAYLSAGASRNAGAIAKVYAECFAGIADVTPNAVQHALLKASSRIFFRALGCEVDTEPFLAFFARARSHLKQLQYYSWTPATTETIERLTAEGKKLSDDFRLCVESSVALADLPRRMQAAAPALDFDPIEELLMNFFAGIETTAATLSFAIDRLGIDQRIQDRLLAEIRAAGDTPYVDCLINETLRYFPAIPFVTRKCAVDAQLGSRQFKAGQTIIVSIVGVHHDPKNWQQPQIFNTSRPEFLAGSYNRMAFIPFLTGPRMCGGATLAKLELVEGLKAFVQAFRVERSGDEIAFDYAIALRPNSWHQVRLSRL